MGDFQQKFRSLHEEFERFVDDFFFGRSPFSCPLGAFSPPTDVYETPEEVCVRVEIPGVQSRDVTVTVEGDRLTVRGVRSEPGTSEKTAYHRKDVHFGPFLAQVRLPDPVQAGRAKARMENGFLMVRVPRAAPRAGEKAVRVEILEEKP